VAASHTEEGSAVLLVRSTYDFPPPVKARFVRDSGGKRRFTADFDDSTKRGAVRILLDGSKAGLARPKRTCSIPLAPGEHTLRVRWRWYFSAPVRIEVRARQHVEFTATVRDTFKLKGFFRLLFRPNTSLVLERVDNDADTLPT
jgi:hypothetical protein